jgi:hypothetical protein
MVFARLEHNAGRRPCPLQEWAANRPSAAGSQRKRRPRRSG